jgi:hypothetical protein
MGCFFQKNQNYYDRFFKIKQEFIVFPFFFQFYDCSFSKTIIALGDIHLAHFCCYYVRIKKTCLLWIFERLLTLTTETFHLWL